MPVSTLSKKTEGKLTKACSSMVKEIQLSSLRPIDH